MFILLCPQVGKMDIYVSMLVTLMKGQNAFVRTVVNKDRKTKETDWQAEQDRGP